MEQAELELGFETHESQLCIEAVTDVEQGFVITITRMMKMVILSLFISLLRTGIDEMI